mgnify:CR=1 FL=1
MQMKSENLLKIKRKLKSLLNNKEIIDIVLFGSAIKGKAMPRDIDIAIISKENINVKIENFHISTLKPIDFFLDVPSLVNTLLREGYSIKKDAPFAELFRFKPKVMFVYSLKGLSASEKVKAVNFLRGKNKSKGIVEENNGEWLANQVFIMPVEPEHILSQFLINSKIKFKKSYVLMH